MLDYKNCAPKLNNNFMENKETVDSYLSHEFYHQSFHSDCSSCFRENRLLKAHTTVNSDWEKLYPEQGRNQHALDRLDYGEHNRNPLGE